MKDPDPDQEAEDLYRWEQAQYDWDGFKAWCFSLGVIAVVLIIAGTCLLGGSK